MLRMQRLFSRALRLPLRLVPPTAVLRVLSGDLRGRRWIAGAATHGCWLGTYEKLVQRIFRERIPPGSVVYDIGANVGFFTLLASKLAGPSGRVYAFEPLPRNLTYLREHLRINAVSNVDVLELAVSDREGMAFFQTGGNPAMGGLSGSGDLEVRTASLDDLARDGNLAPPTFVKMDIEGAEHAALTGAVDLLLRWRPVILLSEHGSAQHLLCGELFRRLGYELELLVDGAADGNYVVCATATA